MKQKNDYRKYGLVGTIVFHSVLLLLLIFLGMRAMEQEEEGLLVNFGDTETGSGVEEPKESKAEPVEKTTPPPPTRSEPTKAPVVKEAVNTQDFEEAAAIKEEKKRKEEAKRKENEAKRLADAEAKRIRDEEARKQREAEEAERKKQEELAKQKAAAQNTVKNAFGGKGTGATTSEGNTTGSGNQGQLTGDPNSANRTGSGTGTKGSGFSLSGRSLVGSLPKPAYNIDEEGIVVVDIVVDPSGKVVNAQWRQSGSTTTNQELRNAAIAAALKAKFNADAKATTNQRGTITYHFNME